MSGTHVYYNNVLMRDCETLEWSNIVDYDETGTYERYCRTRITVASTLVSIIDPGTSAPLSVSDQHSSTIRIPSVTGDETMVGRLEEIEILLNQPRKDFWYATNGAAPNNPTTVPKESNTGASSYRLILVATGIIPSPTSTAPADVYVQMFTNALSVKRIDVLDADNGPKSHDVTVGKVFGGKVTRIQATFEICRVLSKPVPDDDNPDPGYDAQKVRGVISNTWSCVDSLDDDGAVTHNISGKLVVKDRRYKVNAMRLYAFPLAFPYARVVDRRHIVDETGLVLQYEYQLKHAGAAPPQGIRKYEAVYSEVVNSGNNPLQTASMAIKVSGWFDRTLTAPLNEKEQQQKYILLRGAYTILWSRIRGLNKLWNPIPGQGGKKVHLVRAEAIEVLGRPNLELRVEVKYVDEDNSEFHLRLKNFGLPIDVPDYDPRWWPIDNEWGRLPALDSENPNFDMTEYPYGSSGDPTKSDYFSGYFQPPGNNRHTLPRITGITKIDTDNSREWARPGGAVPSSAATPSTPSTPEPTANPMAGPPITAIISKNLSGEVQYGAVPPATGASYSGLSDIQRGDFAYLQWTSEVLNDSNSGKVMLRLSKPRTIPAAKLTALGVSGSGSTGKECAVAIRLHAPISKRVYSVVATRYGRFPELPEPKAQIIRSTSDGGSVTTVHCVETLLKKELITETPELSADLCEREFTLHARYTYGMSNPWAGDDSEGGSLLEVLPVGKSPIDKATAAQNSITVRGAAASGSDPIRPSLFDDQPQYG